jgi:hypothetical protein
MAVLAACLAFLPLLALADDAAPLVIADAETRDPPSQERLASISSAAATSGWEGMVVPLREAALKAYSRDRFVAAGAWLNAYRWAVLFSEPESRFIPMWINAVVSAGANYEGMQNSFTPTQRPLGLGMSPALQAWVFSNSAFSAEFFSDYKAVDYLPKVFSILDELYQKDPATFARYQSLALAISLVYDVVPPPFWPHYQVSAESLPRAFPDPAVTYDRLVREDGQGRTYMRISRLKADELKFVVDTAAPTSELDWSEGSITYPLDQFDKVYDMIKYRTDRASEESGMVWMGLPYTLQQILVQGGICVDQAYFATEAGKARGVPTLLFTGGGRDGRHAWFGYLNAEHKWELDAGRYAEQRLVTGNALDPQTWTTISDHELQFLAERFRTLPSYAQSKVQEEFAEDFLVNSDPHNAAVAARRAVNYEKRNVDAWEILIQANARLNVDPRTQESVMREASLAFSPKYPDLMASYVNRYCTSLRARGETSRADYEEKGLADRLKGDRSDLAITQAAAILSRSIATQSVQDQIATYNGILAQFAHGSGTAFFDQIVTAFAEHLGKLGMKSQAREAVERARDALEVQDGTMFSVEVQKLQGKFQD